MTRLDIEQLLFTLNSIAAILAYDAHLHKLMIVFAGFAMLDALCALVVILKGGYGQ